MTETIDTRRKKRMTFKQRSIRINWFTGPDDDEFEFEILNRPVMTLQGEGIKDLMNCLMDLTEEFKKLAEKGGKNGK